MQSQRSLQGKGKRRRQTKEGIMPREDGGRDGIDMATSQGSQQLGKTGRNRKDPPLEPPRQVRIWTQVSRTVRNQCL